MVISNMKMIGREGKKIQESQIQIMDKKETCAKIIKKKVKMIIKHMKIRKSKERRQQKAGYRL